MTYSLNHSAGDGVMRASSVDGEGAKAVDGRRRAWRRINGLLGDGHGGLGEDASSGVCAERRVYLFLVGFCGASVVQMLCLADDAIWQNRRVAACECEQRPQPASLYASWFCRSLCAISQQ